MRPGLVFFQTMKSAHWNKTQSQVEKKKKTFMFKKQRLTSLAVITN
jgi:hypothetical protein